MVDIFYGGEGKRDYENDEYNEDHPSTYYIEGILEDIVSGNSIRKAVTFIVYDLPNRDCKALASNGELCCNETPECQHIGSFYCNIPCQNSATSCGQGMSDYKKLYIDQLTKLFAQKKYEGIKKVLIIEPDSLPNCVTNVGNNGCTQITCEAYKEGIKYAIEKLSAVSNTYLYLDIAHAGWLGWENNMRQMMDLISDFPLGKLRGFATNTANYQQLGSPCVYTSTVYNQMTGEPEQEPGIKLYNDLVMFCQNFPEKECCADSCGLLGQWNSGNNEHNYVQTINFMTSERGYSFNTPDGNPRFVIDTGRNGNADARIGAQACATWCNVNKATVGHFPTHDTLLPDLIDAYAWLKTPGESDGCIDGQRQGRCQEVPGRECVRYDADCGTHPENIGYNSDQECPPEAGQWFEYQFIQLQDY